MAVRPFKPKKNNSTKNKNYNRALYQNQWQLQLLFYLKKKTKIHKKVKYIKKLRHLMNSLSNTNNKATKKKVDTKIVIEDKFYLTGNGT